MRFRKDHKVEFGQPGVLICVLSRMESRMAVELRVWCSRMKGLAANHLLGKALVAQRIEQEPSNLLAAGSTPAEGT